MSNPRVDSLLADLGARPGLVVAYSGGADSAFLLAAGVRALGADRVIAATAYSESLPQIERGPAADFAASLGVLHLTPRTYEMDRDGYRENSGARCYFCKAELLDVLGPVGAERGWPVATGTNADDAVAGFRPGIRAAAERGAITPLRDAGLTKDEIRVASADWGLPTWDKPAAACLSSRIAYGIEISPELLARVERAEAAVRDSAERVGVTVRDLRVRDLGRGNARVELDSDAIAAIGDDSVPLVDAVIATGFDEVAIEPFRSGSMNDALRSHRTQPLP